MGRPTTRPLPGSPEPRDRGRSALTRAQETTSACLDAAIKPTRAVDAPDTSARVVLKHLLTHGFFPREVPQCFMTSSYGETLTVVDADVPSEMKKKQGANWCPLARHNLARVGQLRRPLGVPHPARYFALCREIANNWDRLTDLMKLSRLSVSRPTLRLEVDADRAIDREYGPSDYPKLRARHRRNGGYLVYADVQRCYPSIYTHSIAWAVESRAKVKANLRKPRKEREDLLGDRLDSLSTTMQDGQSVGIPIGPETSHVLAEVVLSAVDCRFQETMGEPLRGFRAVDDYELAFESRSDAEKALAELQSTLLKYELQLNETKTRVVKLPDVLQDSWTRTLRNVGAGDLLALFSRAFELVRQHPDKSVLRYAISIANGVDIERDSWPVYQDILLQCAASEPGTLRYVTTELARARAADLRIDEPGVRELCSYLIRMHAPLGHGSEVAWALWLAIVLEVSLPARELNGLTQMVDPFVPVLALWAEECGRIADGQLDRAHWEEMATDEGLEGSHWLLAYEGATRGWLGGDAERRVAEHEVFGWLSAKDASFFDDDASVLELNRWSELSPYGERPDSGPET